MDDEIEVVMSCGNIFADLGFLDAEERLAKAEMAFVIRARVCERGLDQAQTAEVLGIEPADVSDLMRGRSSRFSMERLESFLTALG